MTLPEAMIGLEVGTIVGPTEVNPEDWTIIGPEVGTIIDPPDVGTLIGPTGETPWAPDT